MNAIAHPDAELLRLFYRWDEGMDQHDALMDLADGVAEDEAAQDAWLALERPIGRTVDALADQIATTPARTVVGLQVKAMVLKRYFKGDGADPLERSLLDDILAMSGGMSGVRRRNR